MNEGDYCFDFLSAHGLRGNQMAAQVRTSTEATIAYWRQARSPASARTMA